MMNHSAFDDHIKKQFGDFQPEVPPHIWENIAAAKNKRRPIVWWSSVWKDKKTLIALAVLLLGLTGVLLFRNDNPKSFNPTDITGQPSQNISSPKENKSTFPNNIQSEEQNTPAEQPSATTTTVQQSAGGDPTINQVSTHVPPIVNKNPSTAPVTPAGKDRPTTASLNKGTLPTSSTDRVDKSAADGKDDNPSASTFRNRKQKRDKGRMQASITGSDMAATDNNKISEPSTDPFSENNDLADLNRKILEWQKLDDEKKFAHKLINKSFNLSPIPCPEKNAAGNKKYIELYGAVDYAFRKFNDTAHSQYLQKRKESTSFSSAFSGGIRYTRVFSNAMSFRAGLNYSQVNEKFRYVQDNIIQQVYIINTNGDTTGSYTSTSTRYKTTQNKYRTIDLPVTIGYEVGNERLHANLNAGVMVNIYSWQKGDVLDTAYRPVSITTGKAQSPYQFKTNIGLGFTAAASIYLKLTDRLHLLGEPYIRYNLSPANKAEITLKQKYTTIGLRLGIRLDL